MCRRAGAPSISLFFEKHFHIIFNSAYTGNPEVLHENIRHVRRQESRKRRSEVNILHSQIQQRQQYYYGFLLIPCYVICKRKSVQLPFRFR